MSLEPFDPVQGQTAAVLEQGQHGRGRIGILLLADLGRQFRGKDLSAEIAAQAGPFIDRGLERRRPDHLDEDGRLRQFVEFALFTARTVVFGFQVGMVQGDSGAAGIGGRAVAAMPFVFRFFFRFFRGRWTFLAAARCAGFPSAPPADAWPAFPGRRLFPPGPG